MKINRIPCQNDFGIEVGYNDDGKPYIKDSENTVIIGDDYEWHVPEDSNMDDRLVHELCYWKKVYKENDEREKERNRKHPYMMVYDGDSFIDGIGYDDLDDAVDGAIETLILWEQECAADWKFDSQGNPLPTKKQIEDWDYMIYNCGCWVVCLHDDGEYGDEDSEDTRFLTDTELRECGWVEWSKKLRKN